MPTKENTKVSFSIAGRLKTYFPFVVVTVPKGTPFTSTVTPGSGILPSVTSPVIFKVFTPSTVIIILPFLSTHPRDVPFKHSFTTSSTGLFFMSRVIRVLSFIISSERNMTKLSHKRFTSCSACKTDTSVTLREIRFVFSCP